MTNHGSRYPRLVIGVALVIAGCGGGGQEEGDDALRRVSDSGNVTVYESAGSLQCQGGGISPQESSMKLIRAGLDVLRSGCGVQTGWAVAAVCGGPTGEIVLHEIRAVNLDVAEREGFAPAYELEDPRSGVGYAWVDCETKQIIQ